MMMRSIHARLVLLGFAACIAGAEAQTVTSNGALGTVNNIPYISSATGTSITLGASPIAISGGNVGIGTTNATNPLDVRNNSMAPFAWGSTSVQFGQLDFLSGSVTVVRATSGNRLDLAANGSTSGNMTISTAGNVGIGTLVPSQKLTVNGNIQSILDNGTIPGLNVAGIVSLGYSGPTGAQNWALRGVYQYPNGVGINTLGGDLDIIKSMNGSTILGTKTDGTSLGNVGISTTSPSAKLEVVGNIKLTSGSGASVMFADGTMQTTAWTGTVCGGDYAESVDVSGKREQYEPGDVLVIDPNVPGQFLKSSEPYSTAVLGIYSTKPGTVGRRQMTPKSDDEVPMAMIGIVPTKVSAENGPIRPGDLLVSASTPGYAMRGSDRSRMLGAVISKALSHLESGMGVIEVGVTLQ